MQIHLHRYHSIAHTTLSPISTFPCTITIPYQNHTDRYSDYTTDRYYYYYMHYTVNFFSLLCKTCCISVKYLSGRWSVAMDVLMMISSKSSRMASSTQNSFSLRQHFRSINITCIIEKDALEYIMLYNEDDVL